MKRIITLLVVFILITSCKTTETHLAKQGKINTCLAAQNIDSYLSSIISTPKLFINDSQADSCVLSLLDSLGQKAIQTHQRRYLEALEAICNIKDGYVSEYLLEIGTAQFYQNFEAIVHYMYLKQKADKNPLRKLIIESISMQLSEGGVKKENEVKEYISGKIKTAKLAKEEAHFLIELQKDFNPLMFK